MANTVEETIAQIRDLHWKLKQITAGYDPNSEGAVPYTGGNREKDITVLRSQLNKLYIRLVAIPID